MNTAAQRICVWSGVVLLVCFGSGFLIAGFLPPPSPGATADAVSALYLQNHGRIRAGMIIVLFGAAFLLPWVTVISLQLRRAEHGWGPLSLIQLTSGTLGFIVFMLPAVMWLVAAYRPDEREPKTVQTLNDLGWLTFVGVASLVMMQNAVIGIAILRDVQVTPVFPRWSGYLNLWTVVMLAPGYFVYCFHTGPLAWNGLITFWIPLVVFTTWFIVMIVLVRRAVIDEEASTDAASLQANQSVDNTE
jgi:hypothetical protein